MKLQYRETKWFAGEVPSIQEKYDYELQAAISQFKEIAPQNQEKVNRYIWDTQDSIWAINVTKDQDPIENWQPEIDKLYDSGDLVLELRPFWNEEKKEVEQFWVLKEKAKEEVNYMAIIPQSDDEKFEMYMKLPPEQVARMLVSCNNALDGILPKVSVVEQPSEAEVIEHKLRERLKMNEKVYLEAEDHNEELCRKMHSLLDERKQLKSRIAELEEQRERLIAKLMNAEDKLKSKESN